MARPCARAAPEPLVYFRPTLAGGATVKTRLGRGLRVETPDGRGTDPDGGAPPAGAWGGPGDALRPALVLGLGAPPAPALPAGPAGQGCARQAAPPAGGAGGAEPLRGTRPAPLPLPVPAAPLGPVVPGLERAGAQPLPGPAGAGRPGLRRPLLLPAGGHRRAGIGGWGLPPRRRTRDPLPGLRWGVKPPPHLLTSLHSAEAVYVGPTVSWHVYRAPAKRHQQGAL